MKKTKGGVIVIKLIALDLDGTLLNSENKLSETNKREILKYKRNGVHFVLCSGRPFIGMASIIKSLGLQNQGYLVSFNGAIIHDMAKEEVIYNSYLDTNSLIEIDQLSHEIGLDYHLQSPSGIFITKDEINSYTAFDSWLNLSPIYVRNLTELQNVFINKVIFVGEPLELKRKIKEIPSFYYKKYNIMQSLDFFFEFLNKKSNKGIALKEVANRLGILPEEIMAIGDNDNDLSMFEYAGLSVAMENGSVKARERADFLTKTNDEDGVAHALEKWLM